MHRYSVIALLIISACGVPSKAVRDGTQSITTQAQVAKAAVEECKAANQAACDRINQSLDQIEEVSSTLGKKAE